MNFISENESKSILLENARILDAKHSLDFLGSIFIQDHKIKKIGSVEEIRKYLSDFAEKIQSIDCQGKCLSAGLLDIQVHFRDPGFEHKEDLITGSKAAVAGGVTLVVCQPNTNPVIDNVYVMSYLQQKAQKQALCNIRFYPAVSQNMQGETLTDMLQLAEMGAVGFTDDGLPVQNAHLMKMAFENSAQLGLVIAQHAEDLSITNKGCINHGKVSEKLGVPGILNASEAVIVERDLLLLEAVPQAHYHVLHVSTKQSMEAIIRAKKKGLNVTCEVSPHHLFLTDEAVLKSGTNAKMNPPLRSTEDTEFLLQALQDGWVDCIATDHAPHDQSSKDLPLENAAFGIVGLETLLPLALKLVHENKMSLLDLLSKLTNNPAKIIREDDKRGSIEEGYIADLVLFDLDEEWTIEAQKFHSKSKNTPFENWKVKGKVKKTFVNGKLVYEDQ